MNYIIMFFIIFLAGCTSAPQCPDVNGIVYSPYTGKAIVIERGFFEPGTFMTEKEFDERAKNLRRYLREYENQLKRRQGS